MKWLNVFAIVAVFALLVGQSEAQYKRPVIRQGIDFQGSLNRTTFPHRGGTAFLHVDINTPRVETRQKKPMNLTVVLDRSGSMDEARKMEYAKSAINYLINQLSREDYFSLVIYDNTVDVLVSPQHIKSKERLKSIVSEITPRGSTNLGGGMIEGFKQAEQFASREFVNRVILLSDGLANQGITDPTELSRIASKYRNKSISLSSMGVGLDYNENLMLALAESGGGNYYFIESPRQLASIFEKEMKGLSEIYAQNASIILDLGRGVTLNDIIGCEWNRGSDDLNIPIGDLYSGEHRDFTIELNIPEGTGTKRVATGTLNYESRTRGIDKFPSFTVEIRYSDDIAELDKGVNLDVQGKVDVAVSTRKVEQAMQALDAGRDEDAKQTIQEAQSMIQNSPAIRGGRSSEIVKEQLNTLESYSKDLQNEKKDKRAVKKSIQYKNYQTQKKKDD